jgi:WD40 repeat protein
VSRRALARGIFSRATSLAALFALGAIAALPASAGVHAQLREAYRATLLDSIARLSQAESTPLLQHLRQQLRGEHPPLPSFASLPALRSLEALQRGADSRLTSVESASFREDALSIVDAAETDLTQRQNRHAVTERHEERVERGPKWSIRIFPALDIRSAELTPDDRWLMVQYIAGATGGLKIWDLGSRSEKPAFEARGDLYVASPVFSSTGNEFASVEKSESGSESVRIRQTGTWQTLRELPVKIHRIHSLKYSPDGQKLMVHGYGAGNRVQEHYLEIWDTSTGRRLARKPVGKGGKNGDYRQQASFAPDSESIVVHGLELHPFVVSVGARPSPISRRRLGSPKLGSSFVAAFSPDGGLAAFGNGRRLEVLRTDTWSPVVTLKDPEDGVLKAAFSKDGSQLMTGSLEGQVTVWSLATGQPVHSAASRPEEITGLLALDHRYARVTHVDRDVTWVDLQTGGIIWQALSPGNDASTVLSFKNRPGMAIVRGKSIQGIEFAPLVRSGELPAEILGGAP